MNCKHENIKIHTDVYWSKILGKDDIEQIMEIFAVCVNCQAHFCISGINHDLTLTESDEHTVHSLIIKR